jgi:hypothetical protein
MKSSVTFAEKPGIEAVGMSWLRGDEVFADAVDVVGSLECVASDFGGIVVVVVTSSSCRVSVIDWVVRQGVGRASIFATVVEFDKGEDLFVADVGLAKGNVLRGGRGLEFNLRCSMKAALPVSRIGELKNVGGLSVWINAGLLIAILALVVGIAGELNVAKWSEGATGGAG